jgi:hypothetical protein
MIREYLTALAGDVSHWEFEHALWWGKTPAQCAVLFAKTSALMSGVPTDELPSDDVWRKDQYKQSPKVIAFFEHDCVLAEACMYGTPYGGRITPPGVINSSICRDEGNIRWRTGNDMLTETDFPHGKYSRRLVDLWTRTAHICAIKFKDCETHEKVAYAWAMHHMLLCIKGFQAGNSRTSRLCLQMCRISVGLKPIAFRPIDSPRLKLHLEIFRNGIFIPYMRHLGAM